VHSSLTRPPKELKAFAKITLDPGETQSVSFALQAGDLACYDDDQKSWIVEPGEFEVLIGRSADDIRVSGRFNWVTSSAT
jgi:beta-glucosidase